MPRIGFIADLHLDHWGKRAHTLLDSLDRSIDFKSLDHLVILGDLTNAPYKRWLTALQAIGRHIDLAQVTVCPGNHDYYDALLDRDDKLADICEMAGCNFGQKQSVTVQATRILCATLWTDFRGNGCSYRSDNMQRGRRMMNDYCHIRSELYGGYQVIKPEDTLDLHEQHLDWIITELEKRHEGPTIVATHHAPLMEATWGPAEGFCFGSDLSGVINQYQPDAWVFGHTHTAFSAALGRTRVVNASVGYPGEDPENSISADRYVLQV